MINIENSIPHDTCGSCNSKTGLKRISLGLNEQQTSSYCLCSKCREDLKDKLDKDRYIYFSYRDRSGELQHNRCNKNYAEKELGEMKTKLEKFEKFMEEYNND